MTLSWSKNDFLAGKDQQQANQPCDLAASQWQLTLTCNLHTYSMLAPISNGAAAASHNAVIFYNFPGF